MTGISSKTVYTVAALHELDSLPQNEVLKIKEIALRTSIPQRFLEQILETDVLSDICKTDNPTLKLFWEDIRAGVLNVFDFPLSELKNYQETANQALNYSI